MADWLFVDNLAWSLVPHRSCWDGWDNEAAAIRHREIHRTNRDAITEAILDE